MQKCTKMFQFTGKCNNRGQKMKYWYGPQQVNRFETSAALLRSCNISGLFFSEGRMDSSKSGTNLWK